MTNPSVLARLAQFIDAEATLMRRFVALLEREEELLIAGETDALLALTRDKSELYQQLQRQHDARTLLLGRESSGVPEEVHAAADARILVPMRPGLRSLNVAAAAAMVLGEALRQTGGFPAAGG